MSLRSVAMVLALFLAAPAAADAFHGHRVYLLAGGVGPREYRPRASYLSGDATLRFRRAVWRGWNARRAHGRAWVYANNCVPDCADGTWHHRRARLVALRVRRRCGRYWYTRVRIRYRTRPFRGSPLRFTMDETPRVCP